MMGGELDKKGRAGWEEGKKYQGADRRTPAISWRNCFFFAGADEIGEETGALTRLISSRTRPVS